MRRSSAQSRSKSTPQLWRIPEDLRLRTMLSPPPFPESTKGPGLAEGLGGFPSSPVKSGLSTRARVKSGWQTSEMKCHPTAVEHVRREAGDSMAQRLAQEEGSEMGTSSRYGVGRRQARVGERFRDSRPGQQGNRARCQCTSR